MLTELDELCRVLTSILSSHGELVGLSSLPVISVVGIKVSRLKRRPGQVPILINGDKGLLETINQLLHSLSPACTHQHEAQISEACLTADIFSTNSSKFEIVQGRCTYQSPIPFIAY